MAELKGSKTHMNLKEAFAGESQANRRYLYFAKVADVVIMMVDASYGFEMETFEFLNMALVHASTWRWSLHRETVAPLGTVVVRRSGRTCALHRPVRVPTGRSPQAAIQPRGDWVAGGSI